jgi:hypothetical protein
MLTWVRDVGMRLSDLARRFKLKMFACRKTAGATLSPEDRERARHPPAQDGVGGDGAPSKAAPGLAPGAAGRPMHRPPLEPETR